MAGVGMKPRKFKIVGTEQRNACMDFIDSTHADNGEVEVTVSLVEESRRSQQNRLMWLWNGQIGEAMGHSPDYAHGQAKLDIGLPMMLADEQLHKRAAFIRDILNQVKSRSHKVAVSYDMIRTRELSVKMFASYLTALDRHYAAQGIQLVSPDMLRAEALMSEGVAA